MKSKGIRLDKEDNMTIDGAILTADSHGDKFQCNRFPPLSAKPVIDKGFISSRKGEVLYHFKDYLVESLVRTCNFQHKIHV